MGFLTDRTLVPQLARRLALPEGQAPRILLLAPVGDQFSATVQLHFQGAGWQVLLTGDVEAAAAALREPGNALILLDLGIPNALSILRRAKLDPRTNPIPVVALFPRRWNPHRPAALRLLADLELLEPFQVRPLLGAAEDQLRGFAAPDAAREQSVRFVFPSSQTDLDLAAGIVASLLEASGLGDDERTSLLAAFREAGANAIQHGNARNASKAVYIHFRRDAVRIAIGIRDEGPGFDFRPYLDQARAKDAAQAARDRAREGGFGGLGILMMVRCTDLIEFNDTGNLITLTKRLHPPEPPAPDAPSADAAPPSLDNAAQGR